MGRKSKMKTGEFKNKFKTDDMVKKILDSPQTVKTVAGTGPEEVRHCIYGTISKVLGNKKYEVTWISPDTIAEEHEEDICHIWSTACTASTLNEKIMIKLREILAKLDKNM